MGSIYAKMVGSFKEPLHIILVHCLPYPTPSSAAKLIATDFEFEFSLKSA
jgi:hypothetical protein